MKDKNTPKKPIENPVKPKKPLPTQPEPKKEPIPCSVLNEERVREIAREEIDRKLAEFISHFT